MQIVNPNTLVHHRPTGLLDVDPATDRCLHCEGERVARIYQFTGGPMQGQWGWFGIWGSNDNTGIVDIQMR